jgi:Protein of unknown function (DUF3761)
MKKLTTLLLALVILCPLPQLTQSQTAATQTAPSQKKCPSADYYVNKDGQCVHRPVQSQSAPKGATAQCRDGSYSFSQSRRGTCSHHGGVAKWL